MKKLPKIENVSLKNSFRSTFDDTQPGMTCAVCGRPVSGFRDFTSRLKFYTTGMCQQCQDGKKAHKDAVQWDKKITRRKDKRYQVNHTVFITKSGHEGKKWQMLDISEGGLSFRYVGHIWKLEELSELQVVTHDKSFILPGIPVIKAFDSEMAVDACSEYSLMRRGIQFGELSRYQKQEITRFINAYTLHEIE